jgi:hypothetical protein
MSDKEIFDYNDALDKIRVPIEQFVDATKFKILNEEQKPRIQTEVYYRNGDRQWDYGVGIYHQEIGAYRFTCVSSNPMFSFNQSIVNRVKAVRGFLEIQKKELWDKKI